MWRNGMLMVNWCTTVKIGLFYYSSRPTSTLLRPTFHCSRCRFSQHSKSGTATLAWYIIIINIFIMCICVTQTLVNHLEPPHRFSFRPLQNEQTQCLHSRADNCNWSFYYNNVTWESWCLNSTAARLFFFFVVFQKLVQVFYKKHKLQISGPYYVLWTFHPWCSLYPVNSLHI